MHYVRLLIALWVLGMPGSAAGQATAASMRLTQLKLLLDSTVFQGSV